MTEDFTGRVFGRLTVLKRDYTKPRRPWWICQCDCGNIKSIMGTNLRSGSSKSCGCRMGRGNVVDLTGTKIESWTVVERDETQIGVKDCAYWICKCDCGKIKSVSGNSLRNGDSKSCGICQHPNMTHHMTKTPEYTAWRNMKARCYNINSKDYKNYNSRNIKVCDRWLDSFQNFYDDMGPKPGPEFSIERVNNDLGYEPTNCIWIEMKEQYLNRSVNKLDPIKANKIRELYETGNYTMKQLCITFNCGMGSIGNVIYKNGFNK